MQFGKGLAIIALGASVLTPVAAFGQAVNVARSILANQPYTLIYPSDMVATGGTTEPLVINHPNAPLQCSLSIVPVDAQQWAADDALASLDEAAVAADWAQTFPGFEVTATGTFNYQDTVALAYEGRSTDSPQGVPLTILHTEAVSGGNGYTLDCYYATSVAEQARPLVDFIIYNFSTRADATCCNGMPAGALAGEQTP